MSSKLSNARKILKNEGFSTFIKRSFRYAHSFLYMPLCLIKVRNFKSKKIDDLVNFALGGCSGYLAPLQIKSEIKSLLEFIKKENPKRIMEIGTAKGGTLFLLSKIASKDALIISLDLPGGSFGGGYSLWKIPLYKSFAKDKQKIRLIRVDSHKVKSLQKIKKILKGKKLDFLFIDGDHTYEGVKKDFELYQQLVRKGGKIAFHDIAVHDAAIIPTTQKCEVRRFWKELNFNYKKEIIEDEKQGWGGIGVFKKNGN